MIRAIFLDLGNVVLPFDNRRFFRKLANVSPLGQAEITKRYFAALWQRKYESGKISSARFCREICELAQARMDADEFFKAFDSVFDRKANVDFAFLDELAKRYTLLLLSNTNASHFTFVKRRFDLFDAFNRFALSYRVGATKPEARIYQAALEMSGVPARETFYADDIAEYVEAGRAAGLKTARVTSRQELMQQMAAHGIRVPRLALAEGTIRA